jgi:reversibly glycosylated polypeptide
VKDFLVAWAGEFKSVTVVAVEDNAERTFDIGGKNIEHYCHQDIDRELGNDAWIIPRKTDCVRSYGYFKAWQKKPDMMIILDDDCYPHEGGNDFIATHWARLTHAGETTAWVSTLDGGTVARIDLPRVLPRDRERPRDPVGGAPDYFPMLKKAMLIWTELFTE